MEAVIFYIFLYGSLICCIVAVILTFYTILTGKVIGAGNSSTSSKEATEELRKQTDIMQRNRQEAWANTDYFQSGQEKK